jgi:preprotein translocase subunit SecG
MGILDLPKVLMIGFLVIVITIALMPAIVEMVNQSKQSDSLNCVGYKYGGNAANTLSYNSSIPTNTIGCTMIALTPGFIVLGVVMAILLALFYGRAGGNDQEMYQ